MCIRDSYYGDPAFVDVPLAQLLSDEYNDARRALIGEQASQDLRPGQIPGFEAQVARVMDTLQRLSKVSAPGSATNEPTMADMRASVKRLSLIHI